jgi:hypothetical protein
MEFHARAPRKDRSIKKFHQHRVLSIRGKVAAIVSASRLDLVDFIFGKSDRAQPFQAQPGAADDHDGQSNHRSLLPRHDDATRTNRADRMPCSCW